MTKTLINLGIAGILFIVALIAYAIWYHTLSSMSSEVGALKAAAEAERTGTAETARATAELAQLQDAEGAIRSYYVNPDDIVAFLGDLQRRGGSKGAAVKILSVDAGREARPTLELSLTATGPFAAVLATTGAIEYAPYDIRTRSFTLEEGENGGWTGTLIFSVATASTTP